MKKKLLLISSSFFLVIAIPFSTEASTDPACRPVLLTISSNVQNYNVYNAAAAAGWNVCKPVILTINNGVYVWSDNTSLPALDTAGFPSNTQLTINNNGYIMGKGGDGGYLDLYDTSTTKGKDGGPAMNLTVSTLISSSNGYILGGGGGGGSSPMNFCVDGGGGGAGGGNGGFGAVGGGLGSVGAYGVIPVTYPPDPYVYYWPTGGGGGRIVPGVGGASRYCAMTGANASGYCGGCSSGDGMGGGYGGGSGGGGSAGTNDSGSCGWGTSGTGGAGGSEGGSGGDASHVSGGGMVCTDGGTGGGGGWGAPGGAASDTFVDYYGVNSAYGSAAGGNGGHSINTNCSSISWVGGFPAGHILGAVARNQTQVLGTCPSTGAINVSSNITSSWTITGPTTIAGSGSSQVSPSEPLGAYTITWGNVSGYGTPPSESLTLNSFGLINFNGVYVSVPPVVNIWFSLFDKAKLFVSSVLINNAFAEGK
jgi:hypothetical protein